MSIEIRDSNWLRDDKLPDITSSAPVLSLRFPELMMRAGKDGTEVIEKCELVVSFFLALAAIYSDLCIWTDLANVQER